MDEKETGVWDWHGSGGGVEWCQCQWRLARLGSPVVGTDVEKVQIPIAMRHEKLWVRDRSSLWSNNLDWNAGLVVNKISIACSGGGGRCATTLIMMERNDGRTIPGDHSDDDGENALTSNSLQH